MHKLWKQLFVLALFYILGEKNGNNKNKYRGFEEIWE